mmetsp:Transcript_507/g.1837  ORF Transcript_507/g.1837 Transcript_507/m.1837 type:complete len:232 (-) Transcript_507:852-1547(-)
MLISVLFPAPLCPNKATISPSLKSSETSFKATCLPKHLRSLCIDTVGESSPTSSQSEYAPPGVSGLRISSRCAAESSSSLPALREAFEKRHSAFEKRQAALRPFHDARSGNQIESRVPNSLGRTWARYAAKRPMRTASPQRDKETLPAAIRLLRGNLANVEENDATASSSARGGHKSQANSALTKAPGAVSLTTMKVTTPTIVIPNETMLAVGAESTTVEIKTASDVAAAP